MTDKVKVSKWFDGWIKNNKKDKSKGILITCISPCAYHDNYSEYRINNYRFTEKQYLEIREHFEDYVRAILDGYEVEEEKTPLGWIPELEKERIKVTRELEKYACEFKKGDLNYYIYVDRTEMAINFSCMQTTQFQGLCFESVKKAKEAIKAVGEDRILKYYFGVENE